MRCGFGVRLWIMGCVLALAPLTALAATPGTVVVDGVLQGAGGGPVADGQYVLTFALYTAQQGGTAIWEEGPSALAVKGGRFFQTLGAKKPLDPGTLTGLTSLWLGVTVAPEPELPRTAVHSVLFARRAEIADGLACSGCLKAAHLGAGTITADKVGFTYAGAKTKGGPAASALDLSCTGCVSVDELKFDKDVDLGGNSFKAGKVQANDVVATTVQANSFLGDGSKLTGIKIPSGACSKAGEVVKGINPDGSLQCVASMDPAALPADGLDEISNGQLSTEFLDSDKSAQPVPIADNNPKGVTSTIVVPDRGTAKDLTVRIDVSNSTFVKMKITLTDPAGKAYVLFDDGKVVGGVLKAAFPVPVKPLSGDLTVWKGKNPKGKWTLQVVDNDFKNNSFDGALNSWQIDVLTLSNKKVQAPGTMIAGDRFVGAVQLKAAGKPPVVCDAANVGYMYVDPASKTLNVCNGEAFFPLAIAVFGTQANPGTSCAQILSVHPAAKTGLYWIDADGLGGDAPWQTVCDMDTDGGGWTLFLRHSDPNGTVQVTQSNWDTGITRAAKGGIKEWLAKTFTEPGHATSAGTKPLNAWVMKLATNVLGAQFTHFKYQPIATCNKHRYLGTGYITSSKLLPGSDCKGWYSSDEGRYLWGEHQWCNTNSKGWMWMSRCSSTANSHILIVNHDYQYSKRHQTVIGANHGGGQWTNYDEDGGAFEFFYR